MKYLGSIPQECMIGGLEHYNWFSHSLPIAVIYRQKVSEATPYKSENVLSNKFNGETEDWTIIDNHSEETAVSWCCWCWSLYSIVPYWANDPDLQREKQTF